MSPNAFVWNQLIIPLSHLRRYLTTTPVQHLGAYPWKPPLLRAKKKNAAFTSSMVSIAAIAMNFCHMSTVGYNSPFHDDLTTLKHHFWWLMWFLPITVLINQQIHHIINRWYKPNPNGTVGLLNYQWVADINPKATTTRPTSPRCWGHWRPATFGVARCLRPPREPGNLKEMPIKSMIGDKYVINEW